MMRFELDGTEYHLGFEYNESKTIITLNENVYEIIDGQLVDEWVYLSSVTINCYHKDIYDKRKARRIALQKLLERNSGIFDTKEKRAYVWNLYHSKSPILKRVSSTVKIRPHSETLSLAR